MKRNIVADFRDEELNDNVNESVDLIENISNSVDIVVSSLENLVGYVNQLNSIDKNVYDELKKMVKLPDESSIAEMVQLKKDIDDSEQILKDKNFLKNLK